MSEFITAYGPKRKVPFVSDKPSRTKQSCKDECDIKFIISRYERTGIVTHQSKYQGQYGDFEPFDFHDAMNVVARASEMFAELPSAVRKKFGNDPGAFLDFATDPANAGELQKMGLGREPYKETPKPEENPPPSTET